MDLCRACDDGYSTAADCRHWDSFCMIYIVLNIVFPSYFAQTKPIWSERSPERDECRAMLLTSEGVGAIPEDIASEFRLSLSERLSWDHGQGAYLLGAHNQIHFLTRTSRDLENLLLQETLQGRTLKLSDEHTYAALPPQHAAGRLLSHCWRYTVECSVHLSLTGAGIQYIKRHNASRKIS